jgi:hypothetical protein
MSTYIQSVGRGVNLLHACHLSLPREHTMNEAKIGVS